MFCYVHSSCAACTNSCDSVNSGFEDLHVLGMGDGGMGAEDSGWRKSGCIGGGMLLVNKSDLAVKLLLGMLLES